MPTEREFFLEEFPDNFPGAAILEGEDQRTSIARKVDIMKDEEWDAILNGLIGVYAADLATNENVNPKISREEEAALAERARDGDKGARHQLIETHLLFALSLASKSKLPMPLKDRVQEANIGLINAVDKFNPERGFRLTTFAGARIIQAMQRATYDTERTIRLPAYKMEQVIKLQRVAAQYYQDNGVAALPEELAGLTGMSVNGVNDILQYSDDALSFDILFGKSEDEFKEQPASAEAVFEDSTPGPEEQLLRHDAFRYESLSPDMKERLELLNDRERWVVFLRLGLHGMGDLSSEEIEEIYHIPAAEVSKVYNTAIKKMKSGKTKRPYRKKVRVVEEK